MVQEMYEGEVTREAIKLHFEFCRHITTLGTAIAVVLLAVGRQFDPLLVTSVVGLVSIAACILSGTSGMLICAYFLGFRDISRFAYFIVLIISIVTGSTLAATVLTVIQTVHELYRASAESVL